MNGGASKGCPLPSSLVFGWGRRSCPGSHLAVNTIFIAIAMTLATSFILPEENTKGKVVLPNVVYSDGAIRSVVSYIIGSISQSYSSHPAPFKCRIVPRSSDALKLLDMEQS
jgi:hypothetical protein